MSTSTRLRHRPADRDTATGRRPALVVLATLNAVAAAGGAWGLASGVIVIGSRLEARLPWQSPTLGGVALLMAVAVPNAVLAVLAWRGDRRTDAAAVATGALLVGWILVELAFLRELSFLHPLYVAVGLLLVLLGRRAPRGR
jgi:hypothetical protein